MPHSPPPNEPSCGVGAHPFCSPAVLPALKLTASEDARCSVVIYRFFWVIPPHSHGLSRSHGGRAKRNIPGSVKRSKLKIHGGACGELGGRGPAQVCKQESFSVDVSLCTEAFFSLRLPLPSPVRVSSASGKEPIYMSQQAQAVRTQWENPWVPILDR